MIAIGTRSHGERKRRPIPALGLVFHKSEWMETGEDPLLSPTISLIEQPPNSTLATHFHRQNQFQLFIHGGGTVGPDALAPVTIHYAGAYTGYGPLVAGDEGIHYFTIRPICEVGAISVEEAREKMVRGPKRHLQAGPVACMAPEALAALKATVSEDVIPPAEDGLGARILQLPPGARLDTVVPAATDCTFAVVLSGSMVYGDAELGRWESLFVSASDDFPAVHAGRGGAQVVLLFTPPKAREYR